MAMWRLWTLVVMYGALYGLMGGVLALRNPAGAAMWALAMVVLHVAVAAALWLRWKAVRRNG
jgi:hypothetical protein